MISVAPLASPGDWVNNPEPGGTTIEVAQGSTFLIRHTLEFDEPENGAYSITIAWLNYDNDPSENLTFVSATAYYTTGPYAGEYQQADVTLSPSPAGEDTRWTLLVMRPSDNKDNRDGQFNVDITLGAYGVGGVPHIPGDHVIPSQFGGIIIVEKYPQSWNRDPITIRVSGGGVEVLIEPESQSGLIGENVVFTVTVTNIGGSDDTYDLTVIDNAGWGPTLSENSLEVPAGENRQTTLSVTVPASASAFTEDAITVTATSQKNTDVSDNDSCITHSIGRGVVVLIEPSESEARPGENLIYTLTVKNTRDVSDTFDLTVSDNAIPSWGPTLSENSLTIAAGASDTATLTVTIPGNAIGSTNDNITVTATLTENVEVTDNDSCIAHAAIVRDVEVSIEDSYQENENGGTLTYTVTVANTGNVPDTYTLENSDTMGWSLGLGNTSLEVPESENRTTTLTVAIPENTIPGTRDNITVRAVSQSDNTVTDSDSCIAQAKILTGVEVSIFPENRIGVPGEKLTYTITVTNIGVENDNFDLKVSDNEDWGLSLSDNLLENVQPGENRILTLSVTIPEDAVPPTEDNITVTATSQTNIAVSDNASCIAHSKFLELTFYPVDDAEVLENKPDNNYGTSEYMYIGYEKNAKRVFLKFKLKNIPAGATIESAELSLRVGKVIGGGEKVQVHRVDNDDWDEHTITWSNKPSVGGSLDNRNLSGGYQRYYWDNVTSFVASQWENENDRVASFGMVGAGENDPPTHYAELTSKEKAEKHFWPFLRVFYRTSANSFSVSISPSYQSALRGRTLNYTVMVKNVGWENSSYNLENRDDAGWAMTLDKVQFENVPPGENRTATLTVTIPDNASPYTRDNVTVTAALMENEDIRGDASCVAHSAVPALEVTITPDYQSGVPGWPLTYEVMVKNVGVENDNYSLEVIDKEDWHPTLDTNLFENVPSGENRTTTLRVTIPVSTPLSTEDEITVTATSQVDNTVENSASCIAHSGFTAVGVSITPENQSGLPENTLAYTVTITNTGNVEDTYDLSVSDNAGWGPTLSESLLEVPIGESRQTTLNVTVPANAPTGTRDNVTITATSRADTTVENSASCIAHSGFMAVGVSIAPENQSGEANYNILEKTFDLEYTVTVANKGTITDTYILTVSNDNADWSLLLSDNTLDVPGGENKTTTLYVEIPKESVPLSTSEITVTATSQTDNTMSDSASCVARVAIVDFEVVLLPSYQRLLLGKEDYYTLTVINTGTGAIPKLHFWSVSDTENWISENVYRIPVPAGESADAYLTVRVPDDAAHGTIDNLTVEVWTFLQHPILNRENKKASAIIHATTLKHEVIVLPPPPSSKRGRPGDNVAFSVWVRNLGLENDTYDLTVVDDALPSWNWRFDDNPLENVENGESRSTTLRVTIPDNVPPGMEDNLMVIATSRKDPTISEFDNGIVLVENFTRGVKVSILPSENSALAGEDVMFTVKVTNIGTAADNFELIASDDLGWSPSLSLSTIRLAGSREGNVALTVRIPEDTESSTRDKIWVIARSLMDNTVEDSASCTAHAIESRGVEVSISPLEDSAEPGRTLTFTVTVKNTSEAEDNYILTVSDDAGWGATLAQSLLTILASESRTTTVRVTVPSDAVENESTQITVVASSQAAPAVSDSFTCRATAKVTEGIPLAVPLAISAFLIGAAILVMFYLLRVRPRKAVRPTFFRERRRLGAISGIANLLRGRRKKARRRVLSFSE